MSSSDLKHTPLHDEHVALGGKIVPFAGYAMPVQYPTGITAEHRAVREAAGLFDVSHMGEFDVRGPDALALVQRISTNDASKLDIGQAQYSAIVDEEGGIIDDLIVYRFADHYMLVVNASNRSKDWAWVVAQAEGLDVQLTDRSDEFALLALQGPRARDILRPLVSVDLDGVGYYRFTEGEVEGTPAVISATGYTGEDGFELYLAADQAPSIWRRLLEVGAEHGLIAAGLGARDSLRLEMGYALYGNDLKLTERGFPRAGYPLVADGRPIGVVTSGIVSPSLGVGIAMGYVEAEFAAPGTEIAVEIRGSAVAAQVARPPFYTEGSIRR
jgi:aminomethyltransferase